MFIEKLIVPSLVKECQALHSFHPTLKLFSMVQFFSNFTPFFTLSDHQGRIPDRLPFWVSSHVKHVT